jgi:hypothetical protein
MDPHAIFLTPDVDEKNRHSTLIRRDKLSPQHFIFFGRDLIYHARVFSG